MPLCVGVKLGPYEIPAPIGVGGMGDVHRARDPRMDLLPTDCDIASASRIEVLRNGTCASDIRLDSAHLCE